MKQTLRPKTQRSSKNITKIKDAIKEAILEGEIANDYEEAHAFMIKKGQELGLTIAL